MDEYQKTPYLKLDPSELNALETESSQVIKAITNVDNPNISWETSNENIVTIQKKSNTEITVTGKNNGSASNTVGALFTFSMPNYLKSYLLKLT